MSLSVPLTVLLTVPLSLTLSPFLPLSLFLSLSLSQVAGQDKPTVISMLGWAGPYDQYHASNAQPHW